MLLNATLPTIEPKEAHELIPTNAQLVDVREAHEWKSGHAPLANHVPLGSLSDSLHLIDKNKQVILCCRAGSRSSRATELLLEKGYDAINLSGGMTAWVASGLELIDVHGNSGAVV